MELFIGGMIHVIIRLLKVAVQLGFLLIIILFNIFEAKFSMTA